MFSIENGKSGNVPDGVSQKETALGGVPGGALKNCVNVKLSFVD